MSERDDPVEGALADSRDLYDVATRDSRSRLDGNGGRVGLIPCDELPPDPR